MPHLTGVIGPFGPLVSVYVIASGPRQQALLAAGVTVPPGQLANLLIDTGAGMTSIDTQILSALGLPPTGTIPIHTPSTTAGATHIANTYDIGLLIPGAKVATHFVQALPVIDGQFKHQGIDGLLGRDVLALGRMIYSGFDSAFMLSF